jgi:predicted dehydrogenase
VATGTDEAGELRGLLRGRGGTVRDGAAPPVALVDAIHGLQVIEAAFESARSGRVVRPAVAPSVGDGRPT